MDTPSGVCVQRLPGQRQVGFAEGFVLGRVRVDELGDVGGQRLPVVDQLGLADLLAHTGADHVDTDDRAVLLADQLDEALGPQDLALAVAAEVVVVGLDLAELLLGLGLGVADGGDLGVAVGDAGYAHLVDHRRVEAGDLLGDEDALGESAVGQLQAGHDVADGVDALDVGLAALAGHDEAPVDGDTGLFVAQTGGDRTASDGNEQQVGLNGLAGLQRHLYDIAGLGGSRELHTGLEADLALAERPLELLGDRLVLGRHQAGESLDDRDLGAERLEDRGELDADDAATEDDDAGWDEVEEERLLAGHDPAVNVQPREGLGVGAGSQDDVLADQLAAGDLDGVLGHETARALDVLDALGLHQALQALVETSDDLVLVGIDTGHVDRLEGRLDAELLALAGGVSDLGCVQQRLGRDTAEVQAGAPELAFLDQGDGQAQLGGTQRAGVTAAASTQDDDVLSLIHI